MIARLALTAFVLLASMLMTPTQADAQGQVYMSCGLYNGMATEPAECCFGNVCGGGLQCSACGGIPMCATPPWICCSGKTCGAGLSCVRLVNTGELTCGTPSPTATLVIPNMVSVIPDPGVTLPPRPRRPPNPPPNPPNPPTPPQSQGPPTMNDQSGPVKVLLDRIGRPGTFQSVVASPVPVIVPAVQGPTPSMQGPTPSMQGPKPSVQGPIPSAAFQPTPRSFSPAATGSSGGTQGQPQGARKLPAQQGTGTSASVPHTTPNTPFFDKIETVKQQGGTGASVPPKVPPPAPHSSEIKKFTPVTRTANTTPFTRVAPRQVSYPQAQRRFTPVPRTSTRVGYRRRR